MTAVGRLVGGCDLPDSLVAQPTDGELIVGRTKTITVHLRRIPTPNTSPV